ncbi:MAG: pyridoxamine 5'-phosphate oxidase family protein [Polyangiaceae bacterium]
MTELPITPRTTLTRRRERGSHDLETMCAILDEAWVCHVGFLAPGGPCVIPTAHVRVGHELYLHGAVKNHMLTSLAGGAPACITVTLLDGLVLARSAMHHSMNYRSVLLFGSARDVVDPLEKRMALDALVDHVVPGRARRVRPPNAEELTATRVVAFPIREGSAKIRTGPPVDLESDLPRECWAGVVHLGLTVSGVEDDPRLIPGRSPSPELRAGRPVELE